MILVEGNKVWPAFLRPRLLIRGVGGGRMAGVGGGWKEGVGGWWTPGRPLLVNVPMEDCDLESA